MLEIKDAAYKWLGILIIILGLFLLGAGLHFSGSDDVDEKGMGLSFAGACFPGFLVTGIFTIYTGVRLEGKRNELERLAGYLKAYRRIKIDALAKKLGVTEYETERRILRCVRHGLLTGYIDRASDEFFNPHGMEGKMMVTCPNCGGAVEELVLDGDTARCPYCESIISTG